MEKQNFQSQLMSAQMKYHWFEVPETSKPKKEIRNNKSRIKRESVVLRQKQ